MDKISLLTVVVGVFAVAGFFLFCVREDTARTRALEETREQHRFELQKDCQHRGGVLVDGSCVRVCQFDE